jgi:Tfp pilus assembly protein PilO
MKKNLILSGLLVVYILGFWIYYKNVIEPQPTLIVELEMKIAEKKRQLLSAQIISKDLHNVNELIQCNLVEDLSDSLAESASIPFLKLLTSLMDDLDIILISMQPMEVLKQHNLTEEWLIEQDYIEIPYSMTILASYKQFGKFLERLEKYPQLIKMARVQIENSLDAASYEGQIVGKPDQHRINLEIHTMTILKASFKGGPEQFN